MSEKLNNLIERLSKGAWAICDQALYVLSAIALNLFLARQLSQEEYGIFTVIYAGLMFIGAIYVALIIEPMQVFADGRFRQSKSDYMKWLWHKHWLLTFISCAVSFSIGVLFFLFGKPLLGKSFMLLGLVAPFALLSWLSRRAAYVYSKPAQAAISSGVYLLLTVIGLLSLHLFGKLTVFSSLVLLGISSTLTSSVLFISLRRNDTNKNERLNHAEALNSHWQYGRWAIITALLMWLPLNFFVVYFSRHDLAASGSWKAITNLYLPAFQANAALSALILPALVRKVENTNAFLRMLWESLFGVIFIALIYSIFLFLFSNQLVHILYAGRYDAQSSLLKLLILMPVLDACCVVLSSALRACEKPQVVLYANLVGVFVLITTGIFLTQTRGLEGAAIATILSGTITAACLFYAVKKSTVQSQTYIEPCTLTRSN